MPVKMRLQRRGKKGSPFFHLVIADGRAPRDGKFIEKIGTYNPTTSPAQINLDFDLALSWLQKGAQPTDTMKAILSYKGVLYKYHLLKGVKKGAMTEEQAEEKFQTWLKDKEARIAAKAQGIQDKTKAELDARMEAETKIRETREAEFAKKRAVIVEAEAKAAAEKAAAEKAAAPAEEAETPAAEETPATETKEEVKE